MTITGEECWAAVRGEEVGCLPGRGWVYNCYKDGKRTAMARTKTLVIMHWRKREGREGR